MGLFDHDYPVPSDNVPSDSQSPGGELNLPAIIRSDVAGTDLDDDEWFWTPAELDDTRGVAGRPFGDV